MLSACHDGQKLLGDEVESCAGGGGEDDAFHGDKYMEALLMAFVQFSCQIPLRSCHHRPMKESGHRHKPAPDLVDAPVLDATRLDLPPPGIHRPSHEQQQETAPKQRGFGEDVGGEEGGHWV